MNLLAEGDESSVDEILEGHVDALPEISSEDDSKQATVRVHPSVDSAGFIEQPLRPSESDSEATIDFSGYRPTKHEIWDVDNNEDKIVAGDVVVATGATKAQTNMKDARACSGGRQTSASAKGYKAGIPLLGKPKVSCWRMVP